MKQDCSYHQLVHDIDHYRTGQWKPAPEERCPESAAFYVSLKVPAGDFEAELLRNLCTGHDARVRQEYREAWRWSRAKTEAGVS